MRYQQGHKKIGGRQKGSENHLTKTVKETVLSVFNEMQSDPKVKLQQFAKDYPRDFYAIAAKLIPTEIAATGELSIIWNEQKNYDPKQKADKGA